MKETKTPIVYPQSRVWHPKQRKSPKQNPFSLIDAQQEREITSRASLTYLSFNLRFKPLFPFSLGLIFKMSCTLNPFIYIFKLLMDFNGFVIQGFGFVFPAKRFSVLLLLQLKPLLHLYFWKDFKSNKPQILILCLFRVLSYCWPNLLC